MAKRVIVRVELTPSAKQKLETISERMGMMQLQVMSRVTEWFAEQPPDIQSAVLGHFAQPNDPAVTRRILERIGAGDGAVGNRQGRR